MSRVVVSQFLTIDGVMETPMWSLDYWNDDIGAFKHDELFAADALLLGRKTYDEFVQSWPARSGDDFTDRINSMPKYVASGTLTSPTWNATRIEGGVAEAVANLKQLPGGDLLIYGSRTLVRTLIENDLVDRYNLLIFPIVLGEGIHFLEEGLNAQLKLIENEAYGTGAVLLVYEPNRDA